MTRVGRVVLLILLACAATSAQTARYVHPKLLIETQDLAAIASNPDVRVLDVRLPHEYRAGHLPGAVNLPAPATDDLDANRHGFPIYPERAQELFRAAGVNNASRVVVYDNQGNRFAARLFYVLEFFGHHQVQVLNGGIRKWFAEGRPLTTEVPSIPPGDFTPKPNSTLLVTSQWVEQHLKDQKVRLVDARSPAEYSGQWMMVGAHAGHIPGAVDIEWTRMITPGEISSFLDAPALAKIFTEAGVTRNETVVTYCMTGMCASEVYFALRLLGYDHVRMYDGSWQDWSSIPHVSAQK